MQKKDRHDRIYAFFSFFITFICSLLIFGSLAAALVHFSLTPLKSQNTNATVSAQGAASYPSSNSFTMLISIRPDFSSEPAELMLYHLDCVKKCTVIMPIPPNLETDYRDVTQSIGEVLKSDGITDASTVLTDKLGIKINYICDISSENFIKIFDSLGGLYYCVPQDIYMKSDNLGKITLYKSPRQYLNGAKIYAIAAFPSYSGGDTQKYKIQSELMKEFISEKFTENYIGNDNSDFQKIFNYVSTDFSMNELVKRADAITNLSKKIEVITPTLKKSDLFPNLVQFVKSDTIKTCF